MTAFRAATRWPLSIGAPDDARRRQQSAETLEEPAANTVLVC